ncbi:MMPL family transporter [Streptomyces sp. SID13666]|uniref:MMPL family transporter n=1 Tax=unclassified Streptomyces TaxID=2593676 RepID=UPI0013C1AB6D|nr:MULTISPECIES: MMPL family transporter [unclassified Streptomyces]NEA59580.1 MMPL family transporter [Streptomyces sp. SID13666]NEA72695.1 MMPL family transporter [Streptomyces sp. SID13588]
MKDNLAARLGAWSAGHRKTAIIGWLLFVVVASVIGGMVGTTQMKSYENGAGDSAAADRILAEHGLEHPAGEMVLVRSEGPGQWKAAAKAVAEGVGATGEVGTVQAALPSQDGRSALIRFEMKGKQEDAGDRVQPVLDAVQKVRDGHQDVLIDEFGDASAGKWLGDVITKDFAKAEWTAVPLALGILLVAFGALVAALLPVGLAVTAFIGAGGLLALGSHKLHIFESTSSVMLLMGLAVGVDYCLFYLRRERDERAAGHDAETALRIAAATSGRAVLVSGLTVMVAMAGMFLSGLLLFKGFAMATILVVFTAMLGSVTVLPALLSLLGDRVERGRLPRFGRASRARRAHRSRHPAGRISGAVLRPVIARPKIFAVLGAGVLLALAVPALGMHTESLGMDKQLPADAPLRTAFEQITTAFPGGPAPARIVVQAQDIEAPGVKAAIAGFTAKAAASDEFGKGVTTAVHAEQDIAVIEVPLAGNGSDAVSEHALATLRDDLVPHTLGPVAEHAYVTGDLAGSVDFNGQLKSGIVPVFVFIMGVTFLLMLFSFRSVTVAVTSILLNLLSVGAAFGVMTAVFQHGWGASLVGTESVGAIEGWMPLFVLVVLFGLSMDYHVFVVSRIREARDRGMSTTEAVRDGVRSTAGAVTSAAAIMVAIFAVFATLSMQDMKQMGVGLAVAVFLDATVVRVLLLPSVMVLLGERNWYLPRWLGRLPKMSHGEEAVPAPPARDAYAAGAPTGVR